MLLVDLNQILIANLMVQVHSDPSLEINEGLVRHLVLNSLRSYNRQFRDSYGSMVVCCDSKKYWRKDIFPPYKMNRKKDREGSKLDWMLVFNSLNKIRDEIRDNLPYRVINVEGAEADDIIAVLAKEFHNQESILIISSDKDFVQLQKYANVSQYSPYLKRFVRSDNPEAFIKEHIIRGDSGDGIPNILSPDNVFLTEEKQKRLNTKKLSEWLTQDPSQFCTNETLMRNYNRNQMLVDFDCIPVEIREEILREYQEAKPKSRLHTLNYLIQHGLVSLVEVADEF